MERYVYVDETGDLGEKGSKFFIITAVWVDDVAHFDRIIKRLRRGKFRKELHKAIEIKANKSSQELIQDILKRFSAIPSTHAQSIILDKKSLYSSYLKQHTHKLYNFVCGYLSNIALDEKKLIIRVDRSTGKQVLIDDFNDYLKRKFHDSRWNREVEIYHSWSHSWSGLQIADVVSWAVFQKFEHSDDQYVKLLEKKLNLIHMWENAEPADIVERAPQGTLTSRVYPQKP